MNTFLSSTLGVAALSLLISTSAGAATLYKCLSDSGVPLYQNEPCPKGKEIRNMSNDDSLSVVPMGLDTPAKKTAAQAQSKSGAEGQVAQSRKSITPGMSRADVVSRIGEPAMTTGEGEDLTWVYMPVDGDSDMITMVVMRSGSVVSVERKPKK